MGRYICSAVSPRAAKYRPASIISTPSSCPRASPAVVSAAAFTALPNRLFLFFTCCFSRAAISATLASPAAAMVSLLPSASSLLACVMLLVMLFKITSSCRICSPLNCPIPVFPPVCCNSVSMYPGRLGSKSA